MTITRKDSRVLAMVIIYQLDLLKKTKQTFNQEEIINDNLNLVDGDTCFVLELVNGVISHNEELINLSNKYLNNWNINRLGLTDGAILKIAIYELLYTNTPKKVCIDEAIELAKDYSDEKVVGMINGVLDKIYHEELGEMEIKKEDE